MVGDIHVSGTHNQGPDWSHYRVLRACFITGLDRGESLEICCLASSHIKRKHTRTDLVFSLFFMLESANSKC